MDGMRTKTKVLSLAALLTGSVVFGMILAGTLDFTKHASAQKTPPAPAAAAAATGAPSRAPQMVALPSFADIAEQVMPAIVSVRATDIIKADKRLKYREVREVMRVINEAGFAGVGLVADRKVGG